MKCYKTRIDKQVFQVSSLCRYIVPELFAEMCHAILEALYGDAMLVFHRKLDQLAGNWATYLVCQKCHNFFNTRGRQPTFEHFIGR